MKVKVSKVKSVRRLTDFLIVQWPDKNTSDVLHRMRKILSVPGWGPATSIGLSFQPRLSSQNCHSQILALSSRHYQSSNYDITLTDASSPVTIDAFYKSTDASSPNDIDAVNDSTDASSLSETDAIEHYTDPHMRPDIVARETCIAKGQYAATSHPPRYNAY